MGNSKSKATEHTRESDNAPAGHMDEANVDDYVPDVMPAGDNVEPQICPTSPDVPQCSNESFHEGVVHQVQHVAPARDGTVYNPISEQQPTGAVVTDDELEQVNALSLPASTNKRTEAPDLASIQLDNEVKRELRNAWRRASYRKKKEECMIKL